jgi:hypothetical protein
MSRTQNGLKLDPSYPVLHSMGIRSRIAFVKMGVTDESIMDIK